MAWLDVRKSQARSFVEKHAVMQEEMVKESRTKREGQFDLMLSTDVYL